jgi:hypothetical protein
MGESELECANVGNTEERETASVMARREERTLAVSRSSEHLTASLTEMSRAANPPHGRTAIPAVRRLRPNRPCA